jgi:hypothetical protein
MTKALEHIASQIKTYRELNPNDGSGMIECLRQITATLYYLEGIRSDYHDIWQTTVHRHILEGQSVSASEHNAHVEVPELYRLRHLMHSAYTVCEAIRSQTSFIKHEMNLGR